MPFIGYFYELFGRRVVIIASMFVSVIAFVLIPYIAPSINLLILSYAINATLSAFCEAHPLVPDYVKKES